MKNFLIFMLGAAAGSVGTWYFVKKKYEAKAQEEIDSVKEKFCYKKNSEEPVEKISEDKETYEEIISNAGYTNYSQITNKPEVTNTKKDSIPYVITPEEFGEFDDYDRITFTYYSDHILADENDEEVEDIEGSVGIDSLTHFGEYEDDSVYVRNDRLRVDYEILLDLRKFSDVTKREE